MKNVYKYIAISALAVVAFSCTRLEEFEKEGYIPEKGETIKVILNAGKGETVSSPQTRIFVGNTSNGKVTYYWNEDDQIGVIPLSLYDAKPNYVTKENAINPNNRNQATFEAYISADGFSQASHDLLIYYPYNSSLLEGSNATTGESYAKGGLTFRLPQQQEQYAYNRELNAADHPSVWAMSSYGLAYDLAGTSQTTDSEGGQTVSNITGDFTLDHAMTYFQFNVYGGKSASSGKDYGDGTWKVANIILEAGHCELGTDPNTQETTFVLSDQIEISGTYKFSYEYNKSDFADVSVNKNNEKIILSNVAGQKSVQVNMHDIPNAPGLGSNPSTCVPTFAVINGMDIKANPKGNLNCLKVTVTTYQFDANNENIVGSDSRVRYYNIDSIVGKDIAGNYYTIDFEINDPVESYTDLSTAGTANTYIIAAPGNYSFDVSVAGNAKLPHSSTEGVTTVMGIDPNNLMQADKKYALDWLWASGLSFESADNGSMTDAEVVQKIINSVQLSGDDGRVSIGLAAGSSANLSGNVLLALYETDADGTYGDIVWTWHFWLGQPELLHYKFPATNRKWVFTNEDWYMMDRNLGAESAELGNPRSAGLYYQRSRKEPMIGYGNVAGSLSWTDNQLKTYVNTKFGDRAGWKAGVAYSNYNTLKYPMSMITNIPYGSSSDYYFAWSSSEGAENENDVTNDTKSFFDPCPSGYRMPTVREWDNLKADIYLWIDGVQASGAIGYCQYEGLKDVLADNTDERAIDYAARIAGGDYYTVNSQFERTYHILKNSGTGSAIVAQFPNTGVLRASDGRWKYLYDDSKVTIIAPGPRVNADIDSETVVTGTAGPDLTVEVDGTTLTVDFANSGTYYYSTSSTGTKRSISDGGTITLSSLFYSSSRSTLYFYSSDNGDYSAATTVTITRSGNGNNRRYSASTPSIGAAPSTTTYTLIITFTDGESRYGWSNSASGSKTWFNGSILSIDCTDLIYSSSASTIYLYTTDASGNDTDVTTVRVIRSGNSSSYSYSVGAITHGGGYEEITSTTTATMALWSSGRVDGSSGYLTYWFGPAGDTGDGWGQKNEDGEYGYSGDGTAPFTESRYTYGMTYTPIAIGRYETNNAEMQAGGAVPIRCIREYDNASAATVSE